MGLVQAMSSSSSLEDKVSEYWNTMLTSALPASQDFTTSAEANNRSGRSDFATSEWRMVFTRARRHVFLVTECKRTSLEGQTAQWNDAVHQVEQYLKAYSSQHTGR